MDDIEVKDIVKSVASMFINAINGINEIVAERDPNHRGANSKDFKLPPVVPQDLVLIRISEISAIVRSQKERLLARWTLEVIDLIEQEHGKVFYFDESWGGVKGRYKYLQRFCGEVATVFPGSSQVKSDFSILKLKNSFRNSIANLSLEECCIASK
ncbi:hypothetical protein DD237_000991 [Peronospora effusa]|uniref:Uncharacterized protein n=1 Tax=Peronospora effusa TaxID=542832 RepID=A0A425C5T8_9STRA|nr:hypothetical protein DD237_000991 [Peronospora effusa]